MTYLESWRQAKSEYPDRLVMVADMPMAGFPAYKADHYANLLLAAGHRVVFGRIVARVEGRAIWEARTYTPTS